MLPTSESSLAGNGGGGSGEFNAGDYSNPFIGNVNI